MHVDRTFVALACTHHDRKGSTRPLVCIYRRRGGGGGWSISGLQPEAVFLFQVYICFVSSHSFRLVFRRTWIDRSIRTLVSASAYIRTYFPSQPTSVPDFDFSSATIISCSCRQLAEVRKASQDRSGGARVVEAEKKLIICAVKKPLKLNESQDGQSRVSRTTVSRDTCTVVYTHFLFFPFFFFSLPSLACVRRSSAPLAPVLHCDWLDDQAAECYVTRYK